MLFSQNRRGSFYSVYAPQKSNLAVGINKLDSTYATAWAQSKKRAALLWYNTCGLFLRSVPVTSELLVVDTEADYEKNTGLVIVETFAIRNPKSCPTVLVASPGPYLWGKDADEAVYHAVVLEEVAKMASIIKLTNPSIIPV